MRILRQAHHFCKVKCEAAKCVVSAALSQEPGLWQALHFDKVTYRFRGISAAPSKVKCRLRGRHSTFARSGTDFVAFAALSEDREKTIDEK